MAEIEAQAYTVVQVNSNGVGYVPIDLPSDEQPLSVMVTSAIIESGRAPAVHVVQGSLTAAGFKVRAMDSVTQPKNGGAVGIYYRVSQPAVVEPEPEPEPAPEAHGGQTRSFWVHWNSVLSQGDPEASTVLDVAAKRDYVLLNTWDHWMVPELKSRNPDIKVFVYKDLSSTRDYDNNPVALQPCGVRYADAPDAWFLKDASGNRITYSGYGGHWLMDVGHAAYQEAWATNVLASMNQYGFDGVLMDNALWTRTAYGTAPAKYSTDAAYQTAYRSMLSWVKAKFAGSGKLKLANLSNARLSAGRWESYTEYLDGAWDEWWLIFNDNDLLSEYDAGWSRVVGEIEKNEAAGKITLVQPHFTAGSVKPFRYALASYLSVNGTKAAISEIQATDGYGLPTTWHAEYDWDLGAPVEDRRSVGTNIWVREFMHGIVVVNCNHTSTGNVTVQLGGTYKNEAGANVTAVSLPGTSGSILRRI